MPTEPTPHTPPRLPLPTVLFSNLDADPADRLGAWRELLSNVHAPVDVTSERTDDFRARQLGIALGDVAVWRATHPPATIRRTSRLIRRFDPECYHLSLVLRGRGEVVWRRRTLRPGPGIYHTGDTSLPVDVHTRGEPDLVAAIGLEVPKRTLPLPRHLADRAIGRPIPDDEGPGALLAQFLKHVVLNVHSYRDTDGPRLGAVAADLLAAVLAHAAECEDALPPHTHRFLTVSRIKAFIQQYLGDPELCPAAVAAAHHISTGHLHRLFRGEGVTVAGLIRQSRLERARAELADPRRAHEPIHAVAARWFLTASEFSRSFRRVYGMPPSEYRNSVRRARAGNGDFRSGAGLPGTRNPRRHANDLPQQRG